MITKIDVLKKKKGRKKVRRKGMERWGKEGRKEGRKEEESSLLQHGKNKDKNTWIISRIH